MSDVTVSPIVQNVEVTTPGPQGIQGPAGVGVPAGGSTGQVLKKASAADYAVVWANETGGGGGGSLPAGGTTGQALRKNSNTDGDAGWATILALPAGGSTGQSLRKNSGTDGDATWQATLDNVLPAAVTASILGGTVERTGLFSTATPATGVAAEATVQSVLSSVTSLYTTLGEALTNGFIGIAVNAEA